jgi:hypothetical protein
MNFDLKDIEGSQDKITDAAALIEAMTSWFHAHYEDPVEHTPYCSAEGGYQYIFGGPYQAYDEIAGEFSHELTERFSADELDEIIAAAVEEIESGGTLDWAGVWTRPLEVALLYASRHRWGPGHVHQFNLKEGRTLCGKPLAACPGIVEFGDEGEITCKSCLRRVEALRSAVREGATP